MINVAELMDDPDFCQNFVIRRPGAAGFGAEGKWLPIGAPTDLPRFNPLQPAKAADMVDFLPEGERASEGIQVWSGVPIILSNGKGVESDIILFNGNKYRVVGLRAWGANGYWHAFAVGF